MPATAMPLNTVGPYALTSSCVDILPLNAGRSRCENIRNEFMMGANRWLSAALWVYGQWFMVLKQW